MSKTSAIYHIVINTYCRKMTIPEIHKRELYQYIFGIIRNRNCGLYRINGIGNHIHMLVELHPSVALATLLQNIKQSSSIWLKQNDNFPRFEGWGKEYFAFTYSKE
ncbi:MAG: transposase [Muribaculaceae bacterium]|nr:transposase [Muribaculaceae bacterium]